MIHIKHAKPILNALGKTVKKPVALVAGYVGSGYHGLQMTPISDSAKANKALPTIENELRKALVKMNYISELNSLDLGKIKWNRSSRTDKGVHATKIVFSAKLEFPEHLFPRTTGNTAIKTLTSDVLRFPDVVQNCNQVLPEQIRLFGCAKLNQGFSARTACHYREYEYMFPISLLFRDEVLNRSDEECKLKIHELNGFLKQFEGSQSFHNFHRLNGKELRGEGKLKLLGSRDRVARRQQLRASGDSDDEEGDGLEGEEGEEYCEDNDIATAPVASAGHGAAGGSPAVLFFPYEDWVPRGRDISAKTQGNIYRCRASWFRGLAGQPMVKVEIAGQSFLLHQIRLMMSAAILSTLRHLPSHFLALSLALPYHLPLPLAPSQGLLLKGGGFARNANGEDWAFGEASRGGLRDKLFMTRSEEEACEAFTKMHIYPRIEMDWMEGGVREDFERTMHKYRVPPSLAQQWAAMLDQHRLAERNTESGEEGGGSGLRRVAKNVERFQRDLQEGGLDDKPSAGHPKKKFSPNDYLHRQFLPNGMNTFMAVRFQVLPSELLTSALRSLASQIALGERPPSVDPRELLQRIVGHVDGMEGSVGMDEGKKYSADYLDNYVRDFPPHRRIV